MDETGVLRERMKEVIEQLKAARRAYQALCIDERLPVVLRGVVANHFAQVNWNVAGILQEPTSTPRHDGQLGGEAEGGAAKATLRPAEAEKSP